MKQTLKRSWIFFLCSIMTMTFCFSACNLFPASISPLLYEKIEGKEAYRVIDIQPNTIPEEDINIVIPAKHKGLPVTEIGDSAFKGIWYVKSML